MTEPKKRRNDWMVWVAVGIAIPILYVLSVGPACWVCVHTGTQFSSPPIFYWPIGVAYNSFGPFHDFMRWYLCLWVDPMWVP